MVKLKVKSIFQLIDIINARGLLRFIPDKTWISYQYKKVFGKKINLDTPRTFNEKIQWLKLNYRDPICSQMVDKYEAKKIVAEKIGSEYIIPTLGVYDDFDEIDFDKLPNQFVLKCTHDSGGLVICKNKADLNIKKAKKKIKKCLNRNYFWHGREWVYKDIKPRIIAEEFMEDMKTKELRDYKFFCFDGVAKLMFIASDRQGNTEVKFDFFDMEFNHLDIRNCHPKSSKFIEKPKNFKKMQLLSEILSEGFPHLRVDFYEVNDKIYFGELTFSHFDGMAPFEPKEWDQYLGDLITLP